MLRGYHPHYAVRTSLRRGFLFSGIVKRVIINPGDYRRALRLLRLYSKRVNSYKNVIADAFLCR
ncbi:hypothetical protein E2V56_12600 [Salmonella enterica]|nr:hypothetical protein [Salmonella enterica]